MLYLPDISKKIETNPLKMLDSKVLDRHDSYQTLLYGFNSDYPNIFRSLFEADIDESENNCIDATYLYISVSDEVADRYFDKKITYREMIPLSDNQYFVTCDFYGKVIGVYKISIEDIIKFYT